MKQYLDACKYILEHGTIKSNRTGVDTIGVHGLMMKFNMDDGFPVVTTKKLAWQSMVGELLGFIRGYDNAALFRELDCKIWDANANENATWLANPNRKGTDDLGRIYGVQARKWRHHNGNIDQLKNVINDLKQGIDNRREIVTHWNPAEIGQMALPPCHLLYQFGLQGDRLNLALYQRSADFPLGVPFNISSYALLLHMVAKLTNKTPGEFTHFVFDAHIYTNQIEGMYTQIDRKPLPLPSLHMKDFDLLEDLESWVTPKMFVLQNYVHHPAINFPFSV